MNLIVTILHYEWVDAIKALLTEIALMTDKVNDYEDGQQSLYDDSTSEQQ